MDAQSKWQMIIDAIDKGHKNINESIGVIGNLRNNRRALEESMRVNREREALERKQFELSKLLGMQQYNIIDDKQKWNKSFMNALGRINA